MARQIRTLLDELKTLVLSHPSVQEVHIRGKEATATRAYLRMRLILQSQDVVEVFVYLVAEGEVVRLQDYSLHWQRADGTLLQRWDTAPHHLGIATFPSHTHRATGEVEPAAAFDWNGLIRVLRREVLPSGEKRADPSY
jgi:hypothetical protein